MTKYFQAIVAGLVMAALPLTGAMAQSAQAPAPSPTVPPVATPVTADPDAFCFIVGVVVAARLRNNAKFASDPEIKSLHEDVDKAANFYAGRLQARMAAKDAGILIKGALAYSVSRDKMIGEDMANCLAKKAAGYRDMMAGFGDGK